MTRLGKLLLLETSSKAGEIALADSAVNSILATRSLAADKRNASDLAIVVHELLVEIGWKPDELGGVVCSLGPGSFTSLRVGLMSGKAMAYAIGCPLYGIDTFSIVAAQATIEADPIWVISDALQGQVYSASFLRTTTKPSLHDELAIRPLHQLLQQFPDSASLTGPGVDSYRAKIPDSLKIETAESRLPRCATMFQLLLNDPASWIVDPWLVEPIYLRGSSAEEKRKKMS